MVKYKCTGKEATAMAQDTVRYIVHTKKMNYETARCIRKTQELYQGALDFIINVCVSHWDEIGDLSQLEAKTKVERLIHGTRNRVAVYREFDRLFPNFPSYLRRDAIARAIGHVSSFVTNSARYDEIRHTRMSNGMRPQKGKAPRFRHDPNIAPSFYRDNMYIPNADGTLSVKLWNGRDWTYHAIAVRSADAHYIAKRMYDGWEMASPSLVRYFGHWAFAYVLRRKRPALSKKVNVIVGVDLGIGNDAVCSAMLTDGTVIARRFIRLASEKDRLEHLRNIMRLLESSLGKEGWSRVTAKVPDAAKRTRVTLATYREALVASRTAG